MPPGTRDRSAYRQPSLIDPECRKASVYLPRSIRNHYLGKSLNFLYSLGSRQSLCVFVILACYRIQYNALRLSRKRLRCPFRVFWKVLVAYDSGRIIPSMVLELVSVRVCFVLMVYPLLRCTSISKQTISIILKIEVTHIGNLQAN